MAGPLNQGKLGRQPVEVLFIRWLDDVANGLGHGSVFKHLHPRDERARSRRQQLSRRDVGTDERAGSREYPRPQQSDAYKTL